MTVVPFEIVSTDGLRVASNGTQRLTLTEPSGRLFRRRGLKGLATTAAGLNVLPLLNKFAGELVAQPDMPAEAVKARLLAIAGVVNADGPQHVEWAVAEVDGLFVYASGENDIVVTRQNLVP